MHPIVRYIILRVARMAITIWIGLTIVFIVSRAMPFNPADRIISQMLAYAMRFNPEEIMAMRHTIYELFGLTGSPIEQYFRFLYNYLNGNMGPSLSYFPTPVLNVIMNALPWTILLLLLASIATWIIGNTIGVIAALTKRRTMAKALEYIVLGLNPIPFAVYAIAYLIFYVLVLKGSLATGVPMGRPWHEMLIAAFQRALPPLTALIIWGWMGNFLAMRNLAIKMKNEDFIYYAKLRGAPDSTVFRYVFRNALAPQFTFLLLSLGMMFTGNALVEYLFSYPGIGVLLVTAVLNADYNLMLGISFLSITGVAIATFILDLVYPIIDPRIRYPGQQ